MAELLNSTSEYVLNQAEMKEDFDGLNEKYLIKDVVTEHLEDISEQVDKIYSLLNDVDIDSIENIKKAEELAERLAMDLGY